MVNNYMEDKSMFTNIGEKIKTVAISVFVISIIGGIIFFLWSFTRYNEHKDVIEYASVYGGDDYFDILTDYGNIAYSGKMGMIYSIVGIIISFISSLFMYGFGEIVTCLHEIKDKLDDNKENERKNINDYLHNLESK
jgi:hypothetical protein